MTIDVALERQEAVAVGQKLKVVFFAPHSAIWVHAFPEALIAEALAQRGHEIVYVTCGRVFNEMCVPMSALRIPHTAAADAKAAACEICDRNKALLRRSFPYRSYDLSSLLTPDDTRIAQEMVASLSENNLLSASFQGIEFGRAALSTFLLVNKRKELKFDANQWLLYKTEARNTLLSLMGGIRVFEQEKPDRLFLYSPGYSVNLVWARIAEQRGVAQYYIQGGNNLSDRLRRLIFVKGLYWQGINLREWPRFRELPCEPASVKYVVDHFIELFRGASAFAYSIGRQGSSADLRPLLGVGAHQKLLLATMSSYDELFAGEVTGQIPALSRGAFSSQLEWLESLIGFLRGRPDLFLLIRVHPREFPNRRDSVKSEHAGELERLLASLPDNVRVNWPSDNLSLYDLAEEVDVCLNAWSNAGKEMGFLGIPVVLYSTQTIFYAADLGYAADTAEEYFAKIDLALRDGWRFDNIRSACRWYVFDDLYSRVDINDSFQHQEYLTRSRLTRAWSAVMRRLRPGIDQRRDVRKRAPALRMAAALSAVVENSHESVFDVFEPEDFSTASEVDEMKALRIELGRLVRAMYGPNLESKGGKLKRNLLSIVDHDRVGMTLTCDEGQPT